MCEKYMKVASAITLIVIVLLVMATTNFFTKDNFKKSTIEKETIACMQNNGKTDETIEQEMVEKQDTKQEQTKTVISVETQSIEKEKQAKTPIVVETQSIAKNGNINTKVKEVQNTNNEEVYTKKEEIQSTNNKEQYTKTQKENTTKQENPVSSYKGYETIGKIEIPKTKVNLPILKKVTVKGMEIAPCLLYTTGSLNQSGTNLIIGHNYHNGSIFSNNNKLQIGDKINITSLDGKTISYTIYSKFITTPEDTRYLKKEVAEPQIILSTCTNDENNRTILMAKP